MKNFLTIILLAISVNVYAQKAPKITLAELENMLLVLDEYKRVDFISNLRFESTNMQSSEGGCHTGLYRM